MATYYLRGRDPISELGDHDLEEFTVQNSASWVLSTVSPVKSVTPNPKPPAPWLREPLFTADWSRISALSRLHVIFDHEQHQYYFRMIRGLENRATSAVVLPDPEICRTTRPLVLEVIFNVDERGRPPKCREKWGSHSRLHGGRITPHPNLLPILTSWIQKLELPELRSLGLESEARVEELLTPSLCVL